MVDASRDRREGDASPCSSEDPRGFESHTTAKPCPVCIRHGAFFIQPLETKLKGHAMTLKVLITIPEGQVFKAKSVYVDHYAGEKRETQHVAELTPGVAHEAYVTSTRSVEVREILPA